MRKISAGILLYRYNPELEFFLVHPGGPLWEGKDDGCWSIPKGLVESEEDYFSAALREFSEETGCELDAGKEYLTLTPRKQPSGKIVHAFAICGYCKAETIESNLFDMEWPPHSGQRQWFPEIDRAGWFSETQARVKFSPGQIGFLDELTALLPKLAGD